MGEHSGDCIIRENENEELKLSMLREMATNGIRYMFVEQAVWGGDEEIYRIRSNALYLVEDWYAAWGDRNKNLLYITKKGERYLVSTDNQFKLYYLKRFMIELIKHPIVAGVVGGVVAGLILKFFS